jgi:hypothetical protein
MLCINLILIVNTDKCGEVEDFFDESGKYIKTVCLVALRKAYNVAGGRCLSYGMSLYEMDTPEANKVLLDFSNSRFKAFSGDVLYVKGRIDGRCSGVSNRGGLFDIFSNNCFEELFFYCQYTREPITKEPGEYESLKLN